MIAIYARQSVDKKDSLSIETQIEHCKHWIGEQPFKTYMDKGYSGSNVNRPGFQNMIRDVKNGLIDKIITYRLDRLSRSTLDFANLIDLLEKHHCKFSSTQENFDTSTPMGEAMLGVVMVFAQLERKTIQRRITDNYYARIQKGYSFGSRTPYGFLRIPITAPDGHKTQKFVPDETKATHLQRIFSLYGEKCFSLGEIARMFNDANVPKVGDAAWNSEQIGYILRNPIYVKADAAVYRYYHDLGCEMTNEVEEYTQSHGLMVFGKRQKNERRFSNFEGHIAALGLHEGLVDAALFLKCQKRLEKNKQIAKPNISKNSWLSGLVKCADCQGSLIVKSANHNRYRYYQCSGRIKHACNARWVSLRVEWIEDAVKKRLVEIIQKHLLPIETRPLSVVRCDNWDAKIAALDVRAEKLIAAMLEGDEISNRFLHENLKKIQREQDALLQEKYEEQKACRPDAYQGVQPQQIDMYWDVLSNAQKNAIAAMLMEKVFVKEDEVQIIWKFTFSS